MTIDKIIEKSLKELSNYLSSSDWYGRENEIVNLFAHKFLWNNFDDDILQMPIQIGIEVAIKQVQSSTTKSKNLVRKDLVIWPKEYQTVWSKEQGQYNAPLAIVEWKVNSQRKCSYDIDWLKEFTTVYPDVIGYSACAFVKKNRRVVFTRIERGKII
jgi:hypothetical protein